MSEVQERRSTPEDGQRTEGRFRAEALARVLPSVRFPGVVAPHLNCHVVIDVAGIVVVESAQATSFAPRKEYSQQQLHLGRLC